MFGHVTVFELLQWSVEQFQLNSYRTIVSCQLSDRLQLSVEDVEQLSVEHVERFSDMLQFSSCYNGQLKKQVLKQLLIVETSSLVEQFSDML